MNCIRGNINSFLKHEGLCLVKIDTKIGSISSLVLEGTENLVIGNEISCVFKSTEAILSKNRMNSISLQNCFEGFVIEVKLGEILAEISVNSGNYILKSIITKNAALQLDLKINDTVFLYVKTNEISLIFE
jgi:molybdate transport system regulatory protein